MADILIRGMKMPKDCPMCKLAHFNIFDEFTGCDAVPGKRYVPHSDYQFWNSAERPEWCPLLPLPEGHGRLGDLDAIIKSLNEVEADFDKKGFNQGACWFHVIAELLKKAPTIVPEEGGNADV